MSPAVGRARKARRVQGISSRLSDIKLRDGRGLTVAIGAAIQRTPTLKRTIAGSSSVQLSVYDPELRLLDSRLLRRAFDIEVDGLMFRFVGASKSGLNQTLTFEDRNIAILREHRGPKKVYARRDTPQEVTRAEFVEMLVSEALPGVRFICPQLHVQQPIRTSKEVERDSEDALDRRDRGLGDAKHLTMDGAKLSAEQLDLAETALRIGTSGNAPFVCLVAVIAALMAESSLGTASPGNVLQALEPHTKIRPAAEEISGFLFGEPEWTGTTAVGYHRAHPDAPAHEIAQAVQKSAFSDGSNYAKFTEEAREVVEAYDGAGAGEGEDLERVKPRIWQVGKDESYWEAISAYAKEVNWRAFSIATDDGGRFYYIDEFELARGVVRLAIDRETDWIPPANVNFDYHRNKRVTEVSITAPVKQWKPPPGAVATLEGYGPASIGFGDAPAERGQRIGLSANREAASGEGRARYVATTIEAPLTEDPEAREATITLRKPTAPLPEPANETETVSRDGGSAAGGEGDERVQRVREFCERQVGKPYLWGAEGPDAYDCSGFVSKALQAGDFLSGRLDTRGLASWGEPGEGELITVHDKVGTGSSRTEHVVIEVEGQLYEAGGISGGVGKPDYSASQLAEFSTKRHPKGY